MLVWVITITIPAYILWYKDVHRKSEEYFGHLAWIRSFIFFSWCLIISWALGVFDGAFGSTVSIPGAFKNDQVYIGVTVLNFGIVFIGYWIIWPIGTVVYGRGKRAVLWTQVLFGIVNGKYAQGCVDVYGCLYIISCFSCHVQYMCYLVLVYNIKYQLTLLIN